MKSVSLAEAKAHLRALRALAEAGQSIEEEGGTFMRRIRDEDRY